MLLYFTLERRPACINSVMNKIMDNERFFVLETFPLFLQLSKQKQNYKTTSRIYLFLIFRLNEVTMNFKCLTTAGVCLVLGERQLSKLLVKVTPLQPVLLHLSVQLNARRCESLMTGWRYMELFTGLYLFVTHRGQSTNVYHHPHVTNVMWHRLFL